MMEKVVIITGPTAVGKTKLSLAIAKRYGIPIINGDAMQVYKGLDIAVAKATKEERQEVKHYLIDIIDSTSEYSVMDYQSSVRNQLQEFHEKNILPLIVGGSGLYIDSVIKNYIFEEEKRNTFLEEKYKKLDNQELHEILQSINPLDASKIHPNNRKRVLRAIEVNNNCASSESRTKKDEKMYDYLLIFLTDNRNDLYDRINKRVDQMFFEGIEEEIRGLYPDHLSKTSSKAIGCKELIDYFEGVISLEEAKELIKKNTRHFAKRQFTWFNNRDDVSMININPNNFDQTIDIVDNLIKAFINK